jgi:hypothetical protein
MLYAGSPFEHYMNEVDAILKGTGHKKNKYDIILSNLKKMCEVMLQSIAELRAVSK